MNDDKRLIEDYLPIEAISEESAREKSLRKGHISTLHLWWARRPLVACRAAVYASLVPASHFIPDSASDEKRQSLGRANAARFVKNLCQYPGNPHAIKEAQTHLYKYHAARLTKELAEAKLAASKVPWAEDLHFSGSIVTPEDIAEGRAPAPRVLDMFAGGGAIPLEALRLGCESYALDLNPVAHVIQLCSLFYPQSCGAPDPTARGMAGPKNKTGQTTWGGLAEEIRYWGKTLLAQAKAVMGTNYPLIPDPDFKGRRQEVQPDWFLAGDSQEVPPGYLLPLAYLWTRTVPCSNPLCGAQVPLWKQTWLHQKKAPYIALEPIVDKRRKIVRFRVRSANSVDSLGFDPEAGSYRGSTVCPFCGNAVQNTYVMDQGTSGKMEDLLMCVVAQPSSGKGRKYLGTDDTTFDLLASALGDADKTPVPEETKKLLAIDIPSDKRESFWCRRYGLLKFHQLFTKRQQVFLGTCAEAIKGLTKVSNYDRKDLAEAVQANLACWLDKLSDYNSSLCAWHTSTQVVNHVFARQALPMVWDYAEINPFSGVMGDGLALLESICAVNETCAGTGRPAKVFRGSATEQPFADSTFDAVVTDPPYYDNISYAKLADYFYIWMRNSLGSTLPQHFATPGTPKKKEAVVDFARSNGDKKAAAREYEDLMHAAFKEANRVLKPEGSMACIYAHRTTLGWSTLVDSLRKAGFMISEAWPLDTEMKTRIRAADNASLATSIFLVARKRGAAAVGSYEAEVQAELERIVRERVETLWDMGISGADLVIACVGAGLRAFTRFTRVEYANGEEVPAERFLTEVETVVLESILARLSKEVGGKTSHTSLVGLDPATRFYILWRYTYGAAELEAGEAIIFANGTHVELDGLHGVSTGQNPLVEKDKNLYRLRDYGQRGLEDELGLPQKNGQPAPLIDVLHRVLWLMQKRPSQLPAFLREVQPSREQLRLAAQALAGPALKGGELANISPSEEMSALATITANWQSVIEDAAVTSGEREEKKIGQKQFRI